MIKKVKNKFGNTVVAEANIPVGTLIFSAQDWVSDESSGWAKLSVQEINALPQPQRDLFLIYSYDVDFNHTIGTSDHSLATHYSNFVNHRCDPNLGFDGEDNVVAIKNIAVGEELTLDYGTFVTNFDQDFHCGCGSHNCRGDILKDDWKTMWNSGKTFTKHIRQEIEKLHG